MVLEPILIDRNQILVDYDLSSKSSFFVHSSHCRNCGALRYFIRAQINYIRRHLSTKTEQKTYFWAATIAQLTVQGHFINPSLDSSELRKMETSQQLIFSQLRALKLCRDEPRTSANRSQSNYSRFIPQERKFIFRSFYSLHADHLIHDRITSFITRKFRLIRLGSYVF